MTVQLVLDIDAGADPLRGWLGDGDRRIAFTGMLELLTALDHLLGRTPPDRG